MVIHDGYGTILGCHVQLNSQNGLEVELEAKRLCTNLAETDCINLLVFTVFNLVFTAKDPCLNTERNFIIRILFLDFTSHLIIMMNIHFPYLEF